MKLWQSPNKGVRPNLAPTDQSNFKIILLKRLKQLLSKLIRPFPKNGQSNLEIRVIRVIKASNKGPDLPTIFVYSREILTSVTLKMTSKPQKWLSGFPIKFLKSIAFTDQNALNCALFV